MEQVLLTFHVRYLEKKSEPDDNSKPKDQEEEAKEGEGEGTSSSKNYKYDHSRPFFTNLVTMIKLLKKRQNLDKQLEKF